MRMTGLPAGRRVAVARGANGQIVVFSPLPISNLAVSELRALGEPAAFVIPSRFHEKFFSDYFAPFAQSLFLASSASLADHPQWNLREFSTSPAAFAGFNLIKVEGMPNVQEHVFFHPATRTLILADLLFNIPESGGWFTRALLKLADIGGKPRPSRLWRTMIRDRNAFGLSLQQIRELDFDRIVPGHGEVIERNAKKVFEEAFLPWL